MRPTFDGELLLHGSTTSPFVRKVRVALIEKRISHRFELTPPWSPTSGIEKLNPLQKVPALALADGTTLIDSRVIVRYLDARQPARPLLPSSLPDQIAVLQIEALADGIGEAVALWTQEGWRSRAARSGFWLDRQRAKVEAGIAALEQQIEPWLPVAEAPLQLAPIAAGAALGFASFWMCDLSWQRSAPLLSTLCQRLDLREAWQLTAPYLVDGAKFPSL